MLSFEPAPGGAGSDGAPTPISRYAFRQLDTPAHAANGGASDLLSAAWEEAEQVRAQARLTGAAEGRAEGLAAARSSVSSALTALDVAVRAFEQLQSETIATLELEASELALRIAEQIIAGALDVQPGRIVDIARGALRRAADRQRVTLVVNPGDLEIVSGSLEQLRTELGGIEHLDVQADRRIDLGGAILRTQSGEIDTTVATQLLRAREIVAAVMRSDGDNHGPDRGAPQARTRDGEQDGELSRA